MVSHEGLKISRASTGVMDLADDDGRGLLLGVERPRRKLGEGREIAPPPFQPDLPNGQDNKPGEHDDNEGGNVVPEQHPAVEVGGVVVHQVEQRILVQHGKWMLDKSPQGVPQPTEKQKDVRNESTPFHRFVSLPSAPLRGAVPSLPQG